MFIVLATARGKPASPWDCLGLLSTSLLHSSFPRMRSRTVLVSQGSKKAATKSTIPFVSYRSGEDT